MTVEILRRETVGHGWYRYTGAVNGEKVSVRVPVMYGEADVKEALQDEYERARYGTGSVFVR